MSLYEALAQRRADMFEKIMMIDCQNMYPVLNVLLENNRARKSRTTLQNKVRLQVLPEQLTLFVNTSVTFKKCIIQ